MSECFRESLSEDESAESGEQGVNQFEDLNVSDLEFKDEGLSEASENEGFDFGFDINGDIINVIVDVNLCISKLCVLH